MDLRRFTEAAQALLAQSHGVASAGGAEAVEPEHMLLALAAQPGAAASLESQAIDLGSLISILTPSAKDGLSNSLLLPSLKLKSLIGAVWEKAKDGPQHQIGIADIIPILLQEDGLLAKKIASTIKPKNIEKALIEVTANVQPNEDSGKYRNLRNYTRCLTDLARHGLLDPVVGRHREVRRLMQVLCRRSKNNPVLVGPPGVGKSSIVEALAQRMADGDVPEMLLGKELFYLDLPALYSGSDYRGLLEERTKGVMADIRACHGNAILLINDLPSVFRATAAQDLGGLLKSALGAGALRCIGVAGLDDYRNSIEKDASLERNFQSILVDELSVDETISVLRGAKGKYEAYHDILLTDGALVAAANLSRRFITDRSLPDKAIDLLDEASSKVRIEWDNMPVAVDSTDRLV
ncbi:AAA family ATPase, partial [Dehalococcoidia bacterium]|nr:AAA family ATPase [Dehalococcoidia bacterium]MCL0101603.1 AAA family ATPase [Dehalococcoidia bacterium]